jgi:AbrB family looped-hinge helix DNA binding protein
MKKTENPCPVPEVCGTTVLGERGQVVIPKAIRESLKLKKGDSFVIMSHGNSLTFVPSSEMKEMLTKMTSMIGTISKAI